MVIAKENDLVSSICPVKYYIKVNRKVQEEPQADAAASPLHQEEEKSDID